MFEIKCTNGIQTYKLTIDEHDTVKELTEKLRKVHYTISGIVFFFKANPIEKDKCLVNYGIKKRSKITFSENYLGGLII